MLDPIVPQPTYNLAAPGALTFSLQQVEFEVGSSPNKVRALVTARPRGLASGDLQIYPPKPTLIDFVSSYAGGVAASESARG